MSNHCFLPDYGAKRKGVVPKGELADREVIFQVGDVERQCGIR
jgi:hypothetical protein